MSKNTLLYLRGAMSENVYLLLGSNEGDRLGQMQEATAQLAARAASGPVHTSSVYETAAWGLEDQPSFLNMALGFDTLLPPEALLDIIREIEARFGRQRVVVWGQRTLDVDVLFFGNRIINTPELVVPHPRLQDRRFALAPLAELAGDMFHPVLGKTVAQLLEECTDPLPVALMG